jgi:uncharacterized protein
MKNLVSNQASTTQTNTQTTMNSNLPSRCIAFNGMRRIAIGSFAEVAVQTKRLVDGNRHDAILVFDADTSDLLEIDTRGSLSDVAQRYAVTSSADRAASTDRTASPVRSVDVASAVSVQMPVDEAMSAQPLPELARARGRPRLGVVAREVTLLPRHWDWLNSQPGGASVALRKLVEEARRSHAGRDFARKSREAAYKFMSPIASGLDSFEEAARALFANDRARFVALLADWPVDVRDHAVALAHNSFVAQSPTPKE